MKIQPNDKLYKLFELVFSKKRATLLSNKIKNKYGIDSVFQLYGALNPGLRSYTVKQLSKKGLDKNYLKTRNKSNTHEQKIFKLKKTCSIRRESAEKLLEMLFQVDFPKQILKSVTSELALGCVPEKMFFYRPKLFHAKWFKPTPNKFILPKYNREHVFHQGARGTCVANAISRCIDHLTESYSSRQFIYHQAKMIDGIIDKEGTYISTGFKILAERTLIDYGTVFENDWRYDSTNKSTKHQGPPPEKCYSTKRIIGFDPVHIGADNKVNDIKAALVGLNSAVVIGVPLYESFAGAYTAQTGIVSLPLPGEGIIGYHAMLIVGYDDSDNRFIVLNSWGKGWASQNPKKFPGHALIPYKYIEQYAFGNYALRNTQTQHMVIKKHDRLNYGKYTVRKNKRERYNRNYKYLTIFKYGFVIMVGIFVILIMAIHFNYSHSF